jgi:serpin B
MKEVLHFDLEPDRLHTAMAALLASLEPPQGKTLYELNIANALWVEQSYSLLPDFVSLCRNHYRAVARPVDFKTAPDAQRKTINDWVEQHTNDKITNLFPPGVPDAGTRLVLTNAVYFKGSWKNKFDPARTHEAAFTLADGKSVQVPMMEQEQYFNYWPERDLQVLEMPYAGDTLSMVVLLPSKTDGLADLEKVLDAKTLGDWLGKLRNQKVAAFLPRFTTTSSSRLDHPLQALGIHDAFSSSVADLSGMTGKKDLFISAVVHKAFVDVNEEGTKAAAATGVEAKSEPYRFRADHPFIFLIRDMRSGSILFIGRVMNPKE